MSILASSFHNISWHQWGKTHGWSSSTSYGAFTSTIQPYKSKMDSQWRHISKLFQRIPHRSHILLGKHTRLSLSSGKWKSSSIGQSQVHVLISSNGSSSMMLTILCIITQFRQSNGRLGQNSNREMLQRRSFKASASLLGSSLSSLLRSSYSLESIRSWSRIK